jgi:hypothetical protein
MQSMIHLANGYDVFFDLNHDTQDFDNIKVKHKGIAIPVMNEEIDSIKDTIAMELNLAIMELAKVYSDGMVPVIV